MDSFLARIVEFNTFSYLLPKDIRCCILKDLEGLLKKVVPLLSILDQNIGIGLRYGLDNPIT